jgi:ABC-2 type transport system permease protein
MAFWQKETDHEFPINRPHPQEFIQIRRDPRTLVLLLLIPIMQLFLLGYAATNDVRNVPLAVFDQDHGMEARKLLEAYRSADYFRLAYEVDSEAELRELLDSGRARAGLIIPPDFTVASTALSAAQLIGQSLSTRILVERAEQRGQSFTLTMPVEVRTQVWYNPDLVSAYFMIPGVIAMILFTLTSIATATAIVRERERGTIEQLIVTPIRSWELVVGKLLPWFSQTHWWCWRSAISGSSCPSAATWD